MKQTTKNAGTGAALGMCFGLAIGSAIESLGIPIGLCLGMSIGLVIGAKKDEIVNKQVAEKGYKIKAIEKKEVSNEYGITLVDNQGNEQTVSISSSTMETELFKVGDIVFIDEDGDIEQAFDENSQKSFIWPFAHQRGGPAGGEMPPVRLHQRVFDPWRR